MRVVIDACVDPRLVEAFAGHEVKTVFDLGWQQLKDNVLMKRLECDVFVTADRGFEYEHNLKGLTFGIVIVHAVRNKIEFYRPLHSQLQQAVGGGRAGEVIHVPAVGNKLKSGGEASS